MILNSQKASFRVSVALYLTVTLFDTSEAPDGGPDSTRKQVMPELSVTLGCGYTKVLYRPNGSSVGHVITGGTLSTQTTQEIQWLPISYNNN